MNFQQLENIIKPEDLARSLIREFLLKYNYKETLEMLEKEDKRERIKMTKLDLIKLLSMERLIKNNKANINPQNTMIEILTQYLFSKFQNRNNLVQIVENTQQNLQIPLKINESPNKISESNISYQDIFLKTQPQNPIDNDKNSDNLKNKVEIKENGDFNVSSRRGNMKKIPRNQENSQQMANNAVTSNHEKEIIHSSVENKQSSEFFPNFQELQIQRQFKNSNLDKLVTSQTEQKPIEQKQLMNKNNNNEQNELVTQNDGKQFNFFNKNKQENEQKQNNELTKQNNDFNDKPNQLENFEENLILNKNQIQNQYIRIQLFQKGKVNYSFKPINLNKSSQMQNLSKKNILPIQPNDIQDIKKLLFNQAQNRFLPNSWSQGFIINDNINCFYGLFQKEGGPCGVIACVQAFYLKYLLFMTPDKQQDIEYFQNKQLKQNCLVAALAEILFNLRNQDNLIRLAIIQQSSYQNVAPIDNCWYTQFKAVNFEQAYEGLFAFKDDFIGIQNSGVTTFLYSVILTKGVQNIKDEMDSPENSLIGHHGHCSQEQVNLFLTGKARSNCFDGNKVLDEDFQLKGIDSRPQFGFLTIFEHLQYIEVGSFLKTPIFPIWIICKEYHYSVLFGLDNLISECKELLKFDLVLYDQLYNSEDRIILTVSQVKKQSNEEGLFNKNEDNKQDNDLTPLIELVMRTKWGKNIHLDWNDSIPIL